MKYNIILCHNTYKITKWLETEDSSIALKEIESSQAQLSINIVNIVATDSFTLPTCLPSDPSTCCWVVNLKTLCKIICICLHLKMNIHAINCDFKGVLIRVNDSSSCSGKNHVINILSPNQ